MKWQSTLPALTMQLIDAIGTDSIWICGSSWCSWCEWPRYRCISAILVKFTAHDKLFKRFIHSCDQIEFVFSFSHFCRLSTLMLHSITFIWIARISSRLLWNVWGVQLRFGEVCILVTHNPTKQPKLFIWTKPSWFHFNLWINHYHERSNSEYKWINKIAMSLANKYSTGLSCYFQFRKAKNIFTFWHNAICAIYI